MEGLDTSDNNVHNSVDANQCKEKGCYAVLDSGNTQISLPKA